MTADEFKRIFLPCHADLYRLAYMLTRNREDAEDLVQDTLLKLWKIRNDLSQISNVRAFSMRCLRNIYIDNCRHSSIDIDDEPPEERNLMDASDIAHEIEARDVGNHVMRLIDRLPEQQRLVITLRDMSDMSYEEIGTSTGLSQGNIRTLLSRARKKIKEQYSQLLNHERN